MIDRLIEGLTCGVIFIIVAFIVSYFLGRGNA